MATITIQVDAGRDVMTNSKTVSAEDLARVVAALRKTLRGGGASRTLALPASLTDTEVLQLWADRVLARLLGEVAAVEKRAVAAAPIVLAEAE
jgi:hypothetical protein